MAKGLAKRITRTNTQTILDSSSGEVKQIITDETSRIDSEPDFVKLYIDDIIKLKNLPSGCNPVLYELLKYMNYQNQIILNNYLRENISKEVGVTSNRFSHILTDLVSNGILSRIALNTYFANPDLFAKGKWVNIRELRLSIKYDNKGRTFELKRNAPEQMEMDLDNFFD